MRLKTQATLFLLLLAISAFAAEDVVKDSKGNEWRVKYRAYSEHVRLSPAPPPPIIEIATFDHQPVTAVNLLALPAAKQELSELIEVARVLDTNEVTLPRLLPPPPIPRSGYAAPPPIPRPTIVVRPNLPPITVSNPPEPPFATLTLEQAEGLLDLLHLYPKPSPSAWEIHFAHFTKAGLVWNATDRSFRVTEEARATYRGSGSLEIVLDQLQPRELDLSGCRVLENVYDLQGHPSLEVINLSRCPALKNVDGLHDLPKIQKIDLFQSTNIPQDSLNVVLRRFRHIHLILPDGTTLNPPREK